MGPIPLVAALAWAGPSVGPDLEEPAAWTAEERALVEGIEASLPDPLRARGLVFVRTPAPALPDDLTTPHIVARADGRRVALGLGGLDARLADWAAAHGAAAPEAADLVARQLVHALAHAADDAHGWSDDRRWRELSGWRSRGAAELDPLSYATAHGAGSAVEDLATVAEWAWAPARLPGDLPFHPGCRAPAKWAWATEAIGAPAEAPACGPAPDLDPARVDHLEVVFVRATTSSAASIGGHSAVVVQYAPEGGAAPRREVFSLVARTGDAGGASYAWRGLTGGFPSSLVAEPWDTFTARYALEEDRDLLRWTLVLDPAEEARALLRLDELRQGWRRRYLFVTRNCTELPEELAEAALGEPLGVPTLAGPDTLLAALHDRGLLRPLPAASPLEFGRSRSAETADDLRGRLAADLADAHPEAAAALGLALRDVRASAPDRRADGYAALGALAPALHAPTAHADVDRLLAWSDAVERDALATGAPRDAADALRGAKAANRAAAALVGAPVDQGAPAALLGALAPPAPLVPLGTAHTPLRRVSVEGWARGGAAGWQPWVVTRAELYASELGAARLFPLAPGLDVHFLTSEVAMRATARTAVRSRVELLSLRRILGTDTVGNHGWSTRLLDVQLHHGARTGLAVTWFRTGPSLELVQAADHRHHLLVGAGVAGLTAASRVDAAAALVGGTGVGLPVRVEAATSSSRQALTRLSTFAEWMGVAAPAGLRSERSAGVVAGARLFEVAGADLAVRASWTATQGAPLDLRDRVVHQGALTLTTEPW